MAQSTSAAPAVIIPTKILPVMRTPQRSSSIPQTMSPPNTQRTEYPLVYSPYPAESHPSWMWDGSLNMNDMLENISSKKYEPNIGTTRQANATQGSHLFPDIAIFRY